jgi:uncharacterized protein (DUF302 family)
MERGIIDLPSPYSVPETVRRLERTVQAHGLDIFARIDHSAEATRVGLAMNPTSLLIFGSPKAGTPLMVVAPSLAIDLPLKALVWQDAQGKVWLSYNDPAYLQERHGVPPDLMPNIAGVGALLAQALKE